jgi:hypothetical protein
MQIFNWHCISFLSHKIIQIEKLKKIKSYIFIDNQADTNAEAVLELLKLINLLLFPFVWKSLSFSVISG